MATVLVGWELGGERGHIALLEPVVEALRECGHDVVVAVKDLSAIAGRGSPLLAGRVVPAPAWPPPAPQPPASPWPTSETVGDDLAAVGLGNEAAVQLRARAWADLIDQLGIDLVLAETAPTLLLAAGTRCPAIAFGSAYGLPPAGRPLPPVLDLQRQPSAASAAHERALLNAFDSADRALGGAGLHWFSDLFAVPTWVCNLAELDPYASLRPTAAPGPLRIPLPHQAMAGGRTPLPLGENVFVYAKPSPVLPALMAALAPRCQRLEVFLANAPATMSNPWSHVTLHATPIDVPGRIGEFSAIVHFGGLNLAAEALFAGVPQLIVPHHLEQSATAQAIQRLGVGHGRLHIPLEPDRETQRHALVDELAQAFFADASLRDRAASHGAQLRAHQQPSLPGLVSLCGELLSG